MPDPKRPAASNEDLDRFRQVVERSLDMVVIFDAAGLVVYLNPSFTRVSGYTMEDAAGKPVRDLGKIPPELETEMGEALRRGEQWSGEWETNKKNGELYWVSTTITPLRDASGRITHLAAMTQDVTVRHALEDELKRREEYFRSLVEGAADVVAVVDMGGTVKYISPSATAVSGWRPEELVGRNMIEFVHPEDREFVLRRFREAASGARREGSTQYRSMAKDGSYNTIDVTGRLLPDGSGYVIHSRDITERIRMEEDLRASEQRFRALAELSPMAIFLIDGPSITYVNPAGERITGLTADELLSMKFWETVSPESQDAVREAGLARQRGEDVPSRYEVLLRRKGGEERWVDFAASRVSWGDRTVTLGTAVDITERRRAEAELRASEERLRWVVGSAPVILWTTDPEGIVTLSEGSALPSVGLSPGETVGKSVFDLYADEPDVLELHRRSLAGESLVSTYTRDGNVLEVRYTQLRDPDGNIAGVLGVGIDITESARSREALRESEERLRSTLNAAPVMIWATGADGITTLSEGLALADLGYAPGELVGTSFVERNRDRPDTVEAYRRALGGETVSRRTEMAGRVFQTVYSPARDDAGNISGVIGVATDITERARAEDALRASEQRFRAMAEATAVCIYILDSQKIIYANPESERVTGYSTAELRSMDFWDMAHPDFREIVRERDALRRRGEDPSSRYEVKILRKDGETRWVEAAATVAEYDGRMVTLGTAVDITERKLAEEALRASEERFRQFAENIEDVVWMTDAAGENVVYVNPAYENIWGLSRESLYADHPSFIQAVHPEDRPRVREMVSRQQRGEFRTEVYRVIRPDGSLRWIRDRGFPIRDDSDAVHRIAGIAEDITDSKLAEDALRESEARLRAAVSGAPIALWATDREGVVTFSAGKGLEPLGVEPDRLAGRCVFDTYADSPAVVESHRRALAGEPSTHRYSVGDLTYESQCVPARDADGNITGVIGVGLNVSERVRAEEALRKSEERYRALYQDNPAMYFTVDEEGTILSVNQFGAAQLGYEADALVGKPVIDLVVEADRKAVQRQLNRCLRNRGQLERFEFRKVRKSGSIVWVREIARAVAGPGGERTILLVCEDITALKEMEAALQKARDELERRVERQMKRRNPYQLTFRELTVLHLIVRGKSDKEIAATLGISPYTAQKHVSRILKRMKAVSRTEASVRALRDGLIS